MKVTFDGPNKLMITNNGVTSIDVKVDLYSDWKEWVAGATGFTGPHAQYPQAMSSVGGDPISGSVNLGATFFLENDWKIRPYEGDHTLTVNGNLFTRDGSSPFVSTLGNYNVLINLSTSNLINTVSTSGSSLTVDDIVDGVWSKPKNELVSPNTTGTVIVDTLNAANDAQALIFAK